MEILVEKNNKVKFYYNGHIFRVRYNNGTRLGILYRVEARTRRSRHPGENRWDIFIFRPKSIEGWVYGKKMKMDILCTEEDVPVSAGGIARWGGVTSQLILKTKVETPFGDEWRVNFLELEEVPLSSATVEERKELEDVVKKRASEGFGPYGRVLYNGHLS